MRPVMLDTALRALTDPASLSKDASVSNEHLQEIAREAHVNSLFDGRSDSDNECVQSPVVLAPGNTTDQRGAAPKSRWTSPYIFPFARLARFSVSIKGTRAENSPQSSFWFLF
jgi:hypothetical protein